MNPEEILEIWRGRIRTAALQSGRSPDSITLLPASKTVPANRLYAFYQAGQKVFGENRIQEAREKIPQLPSACRWHFIGGLQRNKVKDAVAWFDLIHSVDSLPLLEEIHHRAAAAGKIQAVLLEINLAGEASKHGCPPQQALTLLQEANRLSHVEVRGLMTVPPFRENPDEVRPFFAQLRQLRDQLEQQSGSHLPELSMGMTHDYAAAIAEGATIVRIGTGLFGSRSASPPPT